MMRLDMRRREMKRDEERVDMSRRWRADIYRYILNLIVALYCIVQNCVAG